MKADTLNFARLFGADVQYVVPMFQRPYVWERERQWEPLWQDCIDVVEALLDAYSRHSDKAEAEEQVAPHFLGAVVLDPLATGSGEIDARHVVDGQQRLTTLQLLIAAIHSVAGQHDELARRQRVFEKLIRNDADLVSGQRPEQRFKVWPTKFDRAAFASAMEGQGGDEGRPIQEYRYFQEACAEWAAEAKAAGNLVEAFDALQVVVRGFLKLVAIDLEPNDNAQAIFEVLNARGTELLAVDLIKNLVFRVAEVSGEDVDRLYRQYWEKFDSEPWRAEVRVGRLTKARADQFLTYWLVMKTAHDVHAQQVFPVFRDLLNQRQGSVEALVADLAKHADEFDRFGSYAEDSPESQFFYRVSEIDINVFMPLALLLFGGGVGISRDQRVWALKAIESWLVRRAIVRAVTKEYNKLVPSLIGRVLETSGNGAETIVRSLQGMEGPNRMWPTDDFVRERLRSDTTYTSLKRGRLRMILEAVEDSIRGQRAEQWAPRNRLHIEHLLPQTWNDTWPLPAGATVTDHAERDRALHRLGNLTLLTRQLNSAESNLPWHKKREMMREFSTLKLNHSLFDEVNWSEDEIRARGDNLSEIILSIWPGPESPAWSVVPE